MRRTRHAAFTVTLLVLVVVISAACTGTPAASASPATPAASTLEPPDAPSTSPVMQTPTGPVPDGVPPAVMTAARAELARTVGADAAANAMVVSAEAVDWPDGSLGCPQPGMMYVQVITPGYQVVFDVDGVQYDIRASAQGGALLCEPGSPAPG